MYILLKSFKINFVKKTKIKIWNLKINNKDVKIKVLKIHNIKFKIKKSFHKQKIMIK